MMTTSGTPSNHIINPGTIRLLLLCYRAAVRMERKFLCTVVKQYPCHPTQQRAMTAWEPQWSHYAEGQYSHRCVKLIFVIIIMILYIKMRDERRLSPGGILGTVLHISVAGEGAPLSHRERP